MSGWARYGRLWVALGRYALIRELAFRGNFLVKVSVEVLWLGILLLFYRAVFAYTSVVAGWTEAEYMFYVGCYYSLLAVIETLFLENCGEFSELVRNGDLDFYLLKPIDEQFLVTCRTVDWSTVPSVFFGLAVMAVSLARIAATPDLHPDFQLGWPQAGLFLVLFACGVGIAYGFLVMLTSMSVWMTRNQSLYEVWWLFTTLIRYPRNIFIDNWAAPIGFFFTFFVPIMLVVNVPASALARPLDPDNYPFALYTVAATFVLLWVSRRVFRLALRKYRSASS